LGTALYVDTPMMLTWPSEGGLTIEVTFNDQRLTWHLSPDATESLRAAIEAHYAAPVGSRSARESVEPLR
jgi:hypothetical protein